MVRLIPWWGFAQKNMDILMAAYRPRRDAIEEDHNISLYDVRTATDQLLILEQITSGAASKNTGSAVKKVCDSVFQIPCCVGSYFVVGVSPVLIHGGKS